MTRYSPGLRRPAGDLSRPGRRGRGHPRLAGLWNTTIENRRLAGNPVGWRGCAAPSFKSIRAGATDATIKNQLRAAQGQAPNVVIDARSNGLDENSASLGLRRFLGSPWAQRRYTTILILGDDYMIETASPDGAAQ